MEVRRLLHRAGTAEIRKGGEGRDFKVCKVGTRLLEQLASRPISTRPADSAPFHCHLISSTF